jgi:ribonuclease PH
MRSGGRIAEQTREITLEINVSAHAEGSCLVKFGNTHVLCTASVEESIPPFLRGKGKGWVTAEYGMLPRCTHYRNKREAATGKQSGRTQEIQRLIARSLRSVVDLETMGERQIIVDCDVLQADGGTRTAAITGGFVALHLAFTRMMKLGLLSRHPINTTVSAVSCGIIDGEILVDIDYDEDSNVDVDANFVMNGNGYIIEVQGSAEQAPFSQEQLIAMLELAKNANMEIANIQRKVLKLPEYV